MSEKHMGLDDNRPMDGLVARASTSWWVDPGSILSSSQNKDRLDSVVESE